VIAGDRITALSHRAEIPADAELVDATSKFVIPGLWDMHVHALWSTDQIKRVFDLFLANGITSIRDMGSPLPVPETLGWRTEVANGAVLGPRILHFNVLKCIGGSPIPDKLVLSSAA
jgi:predicted amidohydrolase